MNEWSIKGLCAEVCTCESACPCIFLSPPTKGECIGVLFWRIDEGCDGDVQLGGLSRFIWMSARTSSSRNRSHASSAEKQAVIRRI